MKSNILMLTLALAVGGCSVHNPPKVIQPIKILSAVQDINKSVVSDPFCCMLPQDLDVKLPEYGPKLNDLERFEQSLIPYVEKNGVDKADLYEIQNTFETRYYSPWAYSAPPQNVQEASWPLRAFRGGYGSNLRPVPPAWFEEIKDQSNFENYGTLNQKAIALKWMNIRAFPTEKPLYKNPDRPGDGYPFDLLQNSSVNYNEPIFISHTTKDGAWSYIFTNNASGWVKSDSVRMIDGATIAKIQRAEKVFIIEDNIPLYDTQNQFVVYSRVGMVLPLNRSENDTYYCDVYTENNSSKVLSIAQTSAHLGVSKLNKNDLITIGSQMLKNTYGWGGMYGERDCSSMIRDMYTPFGIWLPRNSSAQSHKGEIISFEGLNDDQKLALIKEKGIPFETIIYLKGHVLLYIGMYQESVLVMHNIWGVRTRDKQGAKGRHIIGKAVISTLELGSELDEFDPEMSLLTRALSMNIFTHPSLSTSILTLKAGKKKLASRR
ncbi:MAG: SH3 domain-containing protein [Sulfuricurvum sp.]|uniref:SH3 domain-containing protein n=1 Tax=Sulfuricurvum sp. TaxID=2025608 RepID=UPI00356A9A54